MPGRSGGSKRGPRPPRRHRPARCRSCRSFEGEVTGEAVLQVSPHASLSVRRPVERIGRVSLEAPDLCDAVGNHLQATGRLELHESAQLSGSRDHARFAVRQGSPGRRLPVTRDLPGEVDAPALPIGTPKAKLRERDSELSRPAVFIYRRGHIPDRVPGAILLGIVEPVDIGLHAPRIHLEVEGGAPIVVGVHDHGQAVRVGLLIAARKLADDAVRSAVVGANAHVERIGAVKHAGFSPLRRQGALDGLELDEVPRYGRRPPRCLVQVAVDTGLRTDDPACGQHRHARADRAARGGRSARLLQGTLCVHRTGQGHGQQHTARTRHARPHDHLPTRPTAPVHQAPAKRLRRPPGKTRRGTQRLRVT